MRYILIILTILLSLQETFGQEVLVSPDINIRNDFSYDILPDINDKYVVFRNGSTGYNHETFNDDLSLSLSTEILFEKDRVDVFNVMALDTCYQLIYGFSERDSLHVMLRQLNEKAELVDSIRLFSTHKKIFHRYKYQLSKDKDKLLLFMKDRKNKIELNVIDVSEKRIISRLSFEVNDIEVSNDFRKLVLTNEGVVIMYFEKNNFRFSKAKHKGYLAIAYPGSSDYSFLEIDFESKLSVDYQLKYNNKNNRIVLAGLYGEETNFNANGYFVYNKRIDELSSNEKLSFTPFEDDFLKEIISTQKKSEELISDFVVNDAVLRDDGGVVLFFESYKEFIRRSTYRFVRREDDFTVDNGFVDYYNEDILVVNLNPDGSELWKQVLHKKQFSQDDQAVFSSYFVFKTPSRLRLIYNDEIAKASTISEYLIDPVGKSERRSLFNAEYEDLKLRFRDAEQLSSNSLIIPSEKSYTLNLVKITY